MDIEKLRFELCQMIMQADDMQLKDLNALITDYFDSQKDEEWDTMPQFLKDRINESLRQADAGLGTPLNEVLERIRAKHGLY
ncbi:hypothetical protein [Mucilaginibacter sp.]|uniref:hypothetical protein n=1 Tax=Mucilaginibacter sp. TaxID=1882438 RepID=UPI00326428AF